MTDNIYTAINKVMQSVGYVQKEKAQGLSYSFAGESALIEALRPTMVANEIIMYVSKVETVMREPYTTGKGTLMQNTVITGIVRFVHAPSETFVEVWATGEGSDTGDKSANKAMTGLYKYALRQTFMIETGDDPDKNASVERADIITAAAWDAWNELVKRADKVNINAMGVDRSKTTKTALRVAYKELLETVTNAEEQAKAGE